MGRVTMGCMARAEDRPGSNRASAEMRELQAENTMLVKKIEVLEKEKADLMNEAAQTLS